MASGEKRPFPDDLLSRDLRSSPLFAEADALVRRLRRPGTGAISDAVDIRASPDGAHALFTALIVDALCGVPRSQIHRIDLADGSVEALSPAGQGSRHGRWSPDGRSIAYLVDQNGKGDWQVRIVDRDGETLAEPRLPAGWTEYLEWSPDGMALLLGVAGSGAELSSGQGAMAARHHAEPLPEWLPEIGDDDTAQRRTIWRYGVAGGGLDQIGGDRLNIWEASWSGNHHIVALASERSHEGAWYRASLHRIDVATGTHAEIYRSAVQMGGLTGSPDGRWTALIEALCSDRQIVAGDLIVIDSFSGGVRRAPAGALDVSHIEWCGESLLVAGHSGLATVVARYGVDLQKPQLLWRSTEIATTGRHAAVSALGEDGDCVLIAEGFDRAPEAALIEQGRYRTLRSFALDREAVAMLNEVEQVRWAGDDDLELEGWLLRPIDRAPHPLLIDLHGGPVLHWRPFWLGRSAIYMLMLLARGFAIFLPNPRGSSGRGQDFARQVLGDMGGKDAWDCLAGIDRLVAQGSADPARLAVTGLSYGGYLAAWLVTQDHRFRASVPVAPITSFATHRALSNIPEFAPLFLGTTATGDAGPVFSARSPLDHVDGVETPTLLVAGILDRCTPWEEAAQFHRALAERAVPCGFLRYAEGHGVRSWPAALDFAARLVGWLEYHMSEEEMS